MADHTLTAVGLVVDCADPVGLGEMADPEGHEFCVIARPQSGS